MMTSKAPFLLDEDDFAYIAEGWSELMAAMMDQSLTVMEDQKAMDDYEENVEFDDLYDELCQVKDDYFEMETAGDLIAVNQHLARKSKHACRRKKSLAKALQRQKKDLSFINGGYDPEDLRDWLREAGSHLLQTGRYSKNTQRFCPNRLRMVDGIFIGQESVRNRVYRDRYISCFRDYQDGIYEDDLLVEVAEG